MVKACAPGRVNIIGEHVDYNDGFVLPFATDMKTCVKVRFSSAFVVGSEQFGTLKLEKVEKTGKWVDYVLGVIHFIEERAGNIPPMHIEITSNLPIGAGLSSSAALEVATAKAVSALLEIDLPERELLEIALRAEREFVGVNCGIMDQYTAIYAKKNFALLIDTMNISHRHVPLMLKDYSFSIIDSRVKHELSSGEYNKRRMETEKALEILEKKSYREVSLEDLKSIEDSILKKRAEHVVRETQRTLKAAEALESGDVETLGRLLYESHESLSNLYEVSCEEVDFIVDFLKREGVAGARMVGGGFGGGVLVLDKRERIEETFKKLEREYERKFSLKPRLIRVQSGEGVRLMEF